MIIMTAQERAQLVNSVIKANEAQQQLFGNMLVLMSKSEREMEDMLERERRRAENLEASRNKGKGDDADATES